MAGSLREGGEVMGCDGCSGEIKDIVKEYRDSGDRGCGIFENPVFQEIFGGAIRPGGLSVTKRAMEICGFKNGAKILDMGCGYGVTVEFLQSNYDVEALGIDVSETLLAKGKERNPKLDLSYGDAEMLDFPSLSFDGVFMECVFSLMDNREEALHEAYCVLQKGGKLVISDFYLKEPGGAPTVAAPAKKGGCGQPWHTHEGEDASESSDRARNCIDGAFDPEELKSTLAEMGFKVLLWEDKNDELKDFTATLIMNCGSVKAFFNAASEGDGGKCSSSNVHNYKKTGYFLLIAEKE